MFDLKNFAAECGIADPEKFCIRCEILRNFLEETNKCINLTRITGKEEFDLKHAADSLLICRFFPELLTGKLQIADLGCGAGFPSLILGIANPDLRICSIDSTLKKLRFVESAAKLLELKNLRTVHGRIEELNKDPDFRGHFDFTVARAVADSPRLAAAAADFPRKNGFFVFYKTPGQAAEEIPHLKGRWQTTPEFELPGCGARIMLYSKKI